MADYLYCQRAQLVVLAVCECLRRRNDDALTSMYTERVEILHVADGNTVVIAVAHYLVLYLFPSFKALLDKHLR